MYLTLLWCPLLLMLIANSAEAQQGLTVSIETDPPSEPYPAATWIRFACHVTGNTSKVIYDWILLCSQQNPPQLVYTYENYTNVSEFDINIRSTPSVCLDMVVCNASDMSGNTGNATWRFGRVTGAGLWGTSTLLNNVSALIADVNGDIGTIYCHSSSTSANVGQWISPLGLDITNNFTDPFSIQSNSGPGYFSYSSLELLNPLSQPFTTTYDGVYTCLVPDDRGIMQTLHIGIFSNQYTTPFSLVLERFGRVSESPITLNCPTTGLLPSLTIWRKGSLDLSLVSGGIFEISDEIRDRRNATFDSFLRIYQTHQQAAGIYRCISVSAIDGPVQEGINTTQLDYFIAMYTVGGSDYIDCTLQGVIFYTWTDEYGNTISSTNRISFLVNDSIHHMTYTCSGVNFQSPDLETRYLHIKFVINVPNSALQVTAASSDATPVLGQSYSMNCAGHKTLAYLVNLPSPQWYSQDGNFLGNLVGPRPVGSSSSEIVAQFSTLRTSHAGNYTCQASLSSPALTTPIVKSTTFGITIQLPAPSMSLTVLSSEPHIVGGTFTASCQATFSHHIDTPVSVLITWRRTGGTTDSRVTISETTAFNSLTYQSTYTIRDLSIDMDSGSSLSCMATVISQSGSQFITNSTAGSSTTYNLQVDPVSLSVDVTPSVVSVIDVPPHNSFNLTCSATTSSTSSSTIVFTWSKRTLGSSSFTTLTHNGASIIVTTSGTTSTLATSETQSGGYVYNCSAAVGDSEPSSDTATVNVQGPTVPDEPTSLRSMATTFSTATIYWSIPRVAYTPETYTVIYGTNALNLNERSATISGVSGVNDYSVELTGLQHATLYYYQVQSTNSIGTRSSGLSSVQIRNATVILSITPSMSIAQAGSNFALTCSAVELVDHSGETVVTWKDQDGRTITGGGDFVITRQNGPSRVDYSLQFMPLRVQHTGRYTCEVAIPSVGYNESTSMSVQVVPGDLRVTVQMSGTGQVGTPHQLVCQVQNGSTTTYGSVTYQWTSTCSGQCFVVSQSTQATVGTQYIKAVDSGTHTCTVTDSVGNRGNASVSISTRGVALYHSSNGLLVNNSVVRADGGFLSGSFFCVSGRSQAGVGRWIAPNGDDYTLPGTHAFEVSVGGMENPGLLEISVAGSDGRFPAGQWDGVYSCVIPDESGTEQIIYLGIYVVFGSVPLPVVQLLTASSQGLYPHFTLNCSSSNSAATEVLWTEGSRLLNSSRQNYQTVQLVRSGTTSTYDNLLLISTSNVNELSGQYGCSVRNSFGSSTAVNATFLGITVSEHGEFALGEEVSITCSSDFGVSSIDWWRGNQLVSSSPGSEGVLSIEAVGESDHGNQYNCRANAPFGMQQHAIVINVEVDPDAALSVALAPSNSTLSEGDRFTLTCMANRSLYLQNSPTINFYDIMGNRIVTSDGISVGLTVEIGSGRVMRTLTFDSLDRSHSMEYRCTATITFLPPPHTISKEAIWDLVVKTNNTTLLPTPTPGIPSGPTTTTPVEIATDQGDELSQADAVIYIGSGVGGGVAIVTVFVIIILIVVCCKGCHKRKRGYSMRSDGPTTLGMGTMDHHGAFYPGVPGTTNSMIPLTKFPEGPDLPPRKNNMYVTQQTALAPPNAYESYDTYIRMNPVAATVYTPEAPPPEYDACSSFKYEKEKEEFYAEIPGEYLTFSKGEEGGEVQYGNINSSEVKLHLQNTESGINDST